MRVATEEEQEDAPVPDISRAAAAVAMGRKSEKMYRFEVERKFLRNEWLMPH
jgi:hypothetical protein